MYQIANNHPDIEELRKHTRLVSFKKGEIILRPYDETNYLHAVNQGLVKIYNINARGEESITIIYGPDNLFPLAWIIEAKPQNVFIEALTDCKINLVPKDIFLDIAKRSGDVSYALARKILEQFALYASRVKNLEYKYARERLAYTLLLLAAQFGKKSGVTFLVPRISQEDLARCVNLTRESVSKEISRFERVGLIELTRTYIVIKSPKKLKAELGEDASVMFFDLPK
jgi:CRP-like cAMP-binding protein